MCSVVNGLFFHKHSMELLVIKANIFPHWHIQSILDACGSIASIICFSVCEVHKLTRMPVEFQRDPCLVETNSFANIYFRSAEPI